MKRHFFELAGLCFAVSVFGYTCANASDTHFQSIWSMRLGDTEEDRLDDVAVDQAGNIFVTGYFVNHTNVGGSELLSVGFRDIVVAKYDPDGAHLWSTRFGSTGPDAGNAVAVDAAGNLYVTGVFNEIIDFGGGALTSAGSGDIFVASFTPDGVHRWSRRYGSPFANDMAADIAMTNTQDLIVTGSFGGNVDFGGGVLSAESIDAFVLALDTNGNQIWSTRYGDTYDEEGVELAIDHDDNVYVATFFSISTIFGSKSWRTHLVKFDANGSLIWFRIPQLYPTPPVNYYNTPRAVAVDSEGNVFLAGRLYGDGGNTEILQSAFLNKVSPAGDSIWLRFYPETVPNQSNMLPALTEIVVDESNQLIIAGRIEGAGDLGGGPLGDTGDVFLARLDSHGNHDVSVGFPGSGAVWAAWPSEINLLPSGELVLAGQFDGTLDFGNGVLTSLGYDMFVARIDIDVSLAVAITAFYATGTPTGVALHAKFQSNLDVASVNVYRATGTTDPFVRITSVVNGFESAFEYVDQSIRPGKTYRYMIGVVDEDGEFFSPVVEAESSALRAELLQNVPNPFNPRTTISFTVPEREAVSLVVFDTRGSVVRVLVADEMDFGRHDVVWDGRNDAGLEVSSGVYYCRLRAGAFVGTRKMVLLK